MKPFVYFKTKVDKLTFFECRNDANSSLAQKILFQISDYYFFYVFNRIATTRTHSLREITKEEYAARREEILSQRPDKKHQKWYNNVNQYICADRRKAFFDKGIPAADCIFMTDNPLKKIYEATVSKASKYDAEQIALKREQKREYAQKCGALSKKLCIAYVNAMRIGPEKGKLMKFKESYEDALEKVKSMPVKQIRTLYINLFKKGRVARKDALDSLGIEYFNADVSYMEFEELKKLLSKLILAYTEESTKKIVQKMVNLGYEERKSIFQTISNLSEHKKKQYLAELGFDTDAILDYTLPIHQLLKILAASIGEEIYT